MAGRRAKRIAVLAICLAVLMVLPWIYLSGSAMRSGWRRDASSIDGVKILPARSRGDRLPTIVMIGCLGDLGFALIHKLTEPKTYKIICIDSYANSFPQLWRPFISSPQPPPSSPYFTFINASLDGDKIGSYISEILSQPTAKIVGVVSTLLYPTLSWPSEVCAVVPHLCERSYVGSTASILDSLNSVPNPPWIVATSSRFEVSFPSFLSLISSCRYLAYLIAVVVARRCVGTHQEESRRFVSTKRKKRDDDTADG